MRRDVLELRQFYASRLGRIAREMTARKVAEIWDGARGSTSLGLAMRPRFWVRSRTAPGG